MLRLALKHLFEPHSWCSSRAGAVTCRPDEFVCNNTLCKLRVCLCDGEDDCGDNSDEDPDMCGALKRYIHTREILYPDEEP